MEGIDVGAWAAQVDPAQLQMLLMSMSGQVAGDEASMQQMQEQQQLMQHHQHQPQHQQEEYASPDSDEIELEDEDFLAEEGRGKKKSGRGRKSSAGPSGGGGVGDDSNRGPWTAEVRARIPCVSQAQGVSSCYWFVGSIPLALSRLPTSALHHAIPCSNTHRRTST
jgi:hypothetical protein